jgi:hypothetical protein
MLRVSCVPSGAVGVTFPAPGVLLIPRRTRIPPRFIPSLRMLRRLPWIGMLARISPIRRSRIWLVVGRLIGRMRTLPAVNRPTSGITTGGTFLVSSAWVKSPAGAYLTLDDYAGRSSPLLCVNPQVRYIFERSPQIRCVTIRAPRPSSATAFALYLAYLPNTCRVEPC